MLQALKNHLKQHAFIYRIATTLKAKKIKRIYSQIASRYGQHSLESGRYLSESFSTKQATVYLHSSQDKLKKAKIFYLGTDEHQDKSGFLQSLSNVGDVRFFTKQDGSYGQYGRKDSNWKQKNQAQLLCTFKDYLKNGWVPDILLMQTWEWRIGKDTLAWVKEHMPNCKIINIGWDDRHAYWENGNPTSGTLALSPYIDLVLTSTPEAVEWYRQEGVEALYWPEASNPDFFYPTNCAKKYQVGFVGASYGIRKEIVSALVQAGIAVEAYGYGWPNGRLPLDKTNEFFNQCQIVLGCGTIKQCRDFYALKLRDFDAPMAGSVYVTHRCNELEHLFEDGKEIVTCGSKDDFVCTIKELLSDPERCQKIQSRARKRALKEHTFDLRFALMLQTLENGHHTNNDN